MTNISLYLNSLSAFLWGFPMLLLIIGTGLYLSIGLRGITITKIPYAFGRLFRGCKGSDKGISPFNALMTSLSATVGTGNIVGVATAITLGGPGAVFWMWVIAMVGTATKFAEAVLAVHYRQVNGIGRYVGGPMYYISKGLSGGYAKYLAGMFAFMAGVAGFSTGNMIQSHSIADALSTNFSVPVWVTAVVIFILLSFVLLGGIQRISGFAGKLVPFMTISYILAALYVLLSFYDQIGSIFYLIIQDAFDVKAASGGIFGGILALMTSEAVRFGASRGVLSNEAGMGSAPIAHAASETEGPVQQGVIAMLGTIIDTIIICTMTALAILVTDVWQTTDVSGFALTASAFDAAMPGFGSDIIALALPVFGFTTILGWSYYCEKCWSYILGDKIIIPFRFVWILFACLGTFLKLDIVWLLAEIMTAIMAFPNLIGLILLSPLVFRLSGEYFNKKDND